MTRARSCARCSDNKTFSTSIRPDNEFGRLGAGGSRPRQYYLWRFDASTPVRNACGRAGARRARAAVRREGGAVLLRRHRRDRRDAGARHGRHLRVHLPRAGEGVQRHDVGQAQRVRRRRRRVRSRGPGRRHPRRRPLQRVRGGNPVVRLHLRHRHEHGPGPLHAGVVRHRIRPVHARQVQPRRADCLGHGPERHQRAPLRAVPARQAEGLRRSGHEGKEEEGQEELTRARRRRLDAMSAAASAPALPKFDPLDPLGVGAQLDDEERMIRDTVRSYVREKFLPVVAEHFEAGTFPTETVARELGGLGLLGMHLHGYGCAGASATAYGITCLELEAGDSGLRSFCSVQGSLAMYAIHRWGSEEQKERWLPRMAAGEALGCFGLTEPDAGSNPAGMRTRARRDGSEWVLDGAKMWITNGSVADVAVVWARTEDGTVNGFLVERGAPGFSAPKMEHKLSLRASVTSELVLDGVRVSDDARLPEANSLRGPLSCLNEARYGIVWGAAGAARACYEAALDYARTREQFGKPIASFQLTQAKLAEMAVKVGQSTLLALHLGRLKDAGQLRSEQVSFGKYHNVTAAMEVARSARTVLGANGITLEYPVLRHANNLESVLTYEGTHEMHTLILGQAITGIAAFT